MTVTWRQQIVVYCILIVARMFSDDPQLTQDIKNLSNKITTAVPPPEPVAAAPPASGTQTLDQFASRS